MTQKLRLSIEGDDYVHSSELEVPFVMLNEETFQWLKSAFKGIGFSSDSVENFFDPDAKESTGDCSENKG